MDLKTGPVYIVPTGQMIAMIAIATPIKSLRDNKLLNRGY